MVTTSVQRRRPVQARSRETVERILDAAAAIVDEEGVAAATTRAIADRAGVAYPSLYRFFADRDEILERLLERHLAEVDALAAAAEGDWDGRSISDLLNAEFDVQIDFYRAHPSAARLWMGGRSTGVVSARVHDRMRTLADRLHARLTQAGLLPEGTDPSALRLAIELGDRVLEFAWRTSGDFDHAILVHGRRALLLYVADLAKPSSGATTA